MDDLMYDVIVIGGGPAGLTAGIYLARARYRVLIIEKERFGGQITITSEVVNYPGVKECSGKALTDTMVLQAKSFGAEFLLSEVTSIEITGDVKKVITTGKTFSCFGIVIATGAHPRMIGFEGEKQFKGHGVAYCATCDGEFFTGKEVFVVGGGFAAAEESLFLTKYASHVTVLVRGDDFSCAKSIADTVKAHKNISVLNNSVVIKVDGETYLKTITYKNIKTDQLFTYEADDGFGVFVFAGYSPNTDIFKNLIDIDENGYIITDSTQKTSVDGVYGAGDVCIKSLRQVVTATGDGALAATELEKYCALMQKKSGIIPMQVVTRVEKNTSNEKKEESSSSAIFSSDVIASLKTIFDKMQRELILKLELDDREISKELEAYMRELASFSNKLSIETFKSDNEECSPCVKIYYKDGTYSNVAFHGVPGGHEFTSFMLGLYNLSSEGQPIDEKIKSQVISIDKKISFTILVSLSCTMCPDLVIAATRIASLNPLVSVDVYDINHFRHLKERYNAMSVPCYVINDQTPSFGKKSIQELLNQIGN